MSDEQAQGLVCLRADEYSGNGLLAPGTQERSCQSCGATLLVAPSGLEEAARLNLALLCTRCMPADVEVVGPVPGAAAELDALGIGPVDRQVIEALMIAENRRTR